MIPKLEDCDSPIRPVGFNLVVALDVMGHKIGSIQIPETIVARQDSASDRGRVVAVSPMAFKGGDWADEPNPPQPGDIVLFERYDGKELDRMVQIEEGYIKYRIISDQSVRGVLIEGVAAEKAKAA